MVFRWSGAGITEIGTEAGTGKVRVRVNPKFYRPVENEDLLGSAAKAKEVLGWEPKYTLEKLVEEMVLADIELVKNGKIFSNTNLDWLVDEPEHTANPAITNVKGSEWLADEAESTGDSGITSAKGSDWSVAGSEKTEDTGMADTEKTEDLGTTVIQDRVVKKMRLSNTEETNGHCMSLPTLSS